MGWRSAAVEHGKKEYPRESCGLLIIEAGAQVYVPCRNLAQGTDQFVLSPDDYAAAEERGEIVAVVHSHPDAPAEPSQADRVACEASGLPWHIVSLPSGNWTETKPDGYVAPLVGRTWSHGVLDCYAIVRDWYKQERGIDLLDFERHDDWWAHGGDLYAENFAKAGFREISLAEIGIGDVILMKLKSPVTNHSAVYLGDGLILHHLHGRLSSRDLYSGLWQKITTHVLRHEKNCSAR